MKDPDVCLRYIEYYGTNPNNPPEDPLRVFFGRWVKHIKQTCTQSCFFVYFKTDFERPQAINKKIISKREEIHWQHQHGSSALAVDGKSSPDKRW